MYSQQSVIYVSEGGGEKRAWQKTDEQEAEQEGRITESNKERDNRKHRE